MAAEVLGEDWREWMGCWRDVVMGLQEVARTRWSAGVDLGGCFGCWGGYSALELLADMALLISYNV